MATAKVVVYLVGNEGETLEDLEASLTDAISTIMDEWFGPTNNYDFLLEEAEED
jgi:hypothetical protein